jgi:hypothetical protein
MLSRYSSGVLPFLCGTLPLCCLCVLAVPTRAQQASEAIPDWALYEVFFEDLKNQEAFANRIQAKGHKHLHIRAQIRQKAGLTVEEDLFLKSIAHATLAKQLQARQQIDEIHSSHAKEAWSARSIPQKDLVQIRALLQKDRDLVTEAISVCREHLGRARFAALDRYVRTAVARRVDFRTK